MKLLIVVDMQKDFIDGALGSPEAQAIVPNVKKMIEEYQAAGEDVIFTLDTHDESIWRPRKERICRFPTVSGAPMAGSWIPP